MVRAWWSTVGDAFERTDVPLGQWLESAEVMVRDTPALMLWMVRLSRCFGPRPI